MVFLTGIFIIVAVLVLMLSKKVSALTVLILVPVAGSMIAGFGLQTASFAVEGIRNIAPVAAMFIFAILFFGILTDAGMFDPVINGILKAAGNDPVKIVMGTALLSMMVHLDGSGAVTFLITIPAVLPLFDSLKMDRRVLAGVVALGAGTMNVVPWGGPALRAASALNAGITDLYNPLIIPHVSGLLFVMGIAWYLGRKEKKRLGIDGNEYGSKGFERILSAEEQENRRPKLFWFNAVLTLLTITILISGWIAPAIVFMIGTSIALIVNYPDLKKQKERIDAHAKAALLMAGILLAAGIFTGILKESGMITAIAEKVVAAIPANLGKHIPAVVAVTGMPLSLFFDPDSFYFGVLPVVSEVANGMGVPALSVAQAAILGQMTTGFPISPLTASTFLLIGLTEVDLADHQRFSFLYLFLTTLVMATVAILIGVFPL